VGMSSGEEVRFATWVYGRQLATTGITREAWQVARRLLIRVLGDPNCRLPIHGACLTIPLSHSLPDYLGRFPLYDSLPRRVGEHVRRRQGYLSCIDVGANVGDTIAAFYGSDSDTFLAVEPNARFYELLVENWGWNRNIVAVCCICAADGGDDVYAARENRGTCSMRVSDTGIRMRRRPLDEILSDHPGLRSVNVLKIDTDGYDFEVISGSRGLLKRNSPVVLFECDVFENAEYVADALGALGVLESAGYRHFLVYDNLGGFVGRFAFSDLREFRRMLVCQLTSAYHYYDVLTMGDEDLTDFFRTEADYYAGRLSERGPQRATVSTRFSDTGESGLSD
jgi:FkbM family methyltransferase